MSDTEQYMEAFMNGVKPGDNLPPLLFNLLLFFFFILLY